MRILSGWTRLLATGFALIFLLTACFQNSDSGVHLTAVGDDGVVQLLWDDVPGADSYIVSWTGSGLPESNASQATTSTTALAVDGLRTDSEYSFRLQALAQSQKIATSPTVSARTRSARLQQILVTPATQFMAVGTRQYFHATGVYADGSTQDLSRLAQWSSSDNAIASVIDSGRGAGLVTTLLNGIATISASYRELQGSTEVLASYEQLVALNIVPHDPTIAPDSALAFTAMARFATGAEQDLSASVQWTSSDGATARIANSLGREGVASARGQGSTVIGASFDGTTAESLLTVSDNILQAITLTPSAPSIALGDTLTLTALGQFADGSVRDITENLLWSSSDVAVASVTNYTGPAGSGYSPPGTVITDSYHQPGAAVISASLQGITAHAMLTVTPPAPRKLRIAANYQTLNALSLEAGASQPLTVDVIFSDGSGYSNIAGARWATSDSAVVQIDALGNALGIAAGSATLSVTHDDYPGLTAALPVTVFVPSTDPVDHTLVPVGGCIQCHDGFVASGKSAAHLPTSNLCDTCHDRFPATWAPVAANRVDHTQVLGPCYGCHTKLPGHMNTTDVCDACHQPGPMPWLPVAPSAVDHTQVIGTCDSCHDGKTATGKSATHLVTADDCALCHNTSFWIPALTPPAP